MIARTVRRSRKARYCDSCRHLIAPGDLYLDCRASPNHDDLANPGWWRLADCHACAAMRGNDYLFAEREMVEHRRRYMSDPERRACYERFWSNLAGLSPLVGSR